MPTYRIDFPNGESKTTDDAQLAAHYRQAGATVSEETDQATASDLDTNTATGEGDENESPKPKRTRRSS